MLFRSCAPALAGAQDSFTVDEPQIHALNLVSALSVRVSAGLELGMKIDLFLLGSNDKGQLNSEFFAAWWFGDWGVRAGLSHVIAE